MGQDGLQGARAIHDAGGEILASQVVRELVAGKGFKFVERAVPEPGPGESPTRLYEVRWQE